MRGPTFAKEARMLVLRARSEAVRLGAAETGTEHLLLALADSPTPAGAFLRERGVTPDRVEVYADPLTLDAPLLAQLGIDVESVQRHLDGTFGRDAWRRVFGTRYRRFSQDAVRTITSTATYAKAVRRKRVDAVTVLQALLAEGRSAGAVLQRLGHEPATLASQLRLTC